MITRELNPTIHSCAIACTASVSEGNCRIVIYRAVCRYCGARSRWILLLFLIDGAHEVLRMVFGRAGGMGTGQGWRVQRPVSRAG